MKKSVAVAEPVMTKAARANKKKKTVTDAGVTKPKAPTKCAKKQYGKAKTETPGSIPSGSNCSGLVTAGEKTQTGPGYGLGNNCGSVTQGNPLQQRLADLREVCSFFNEVRSIFAPSPAPPAPKVHAKLACPNCLLTSSEQNSTLFLRHRKYWSLAPWNETQLKTCQLGCFRRQGLALHCKCEISSTSRK